MRMRRYAGLFVGGLSVLLVMGGCVRAGKKAQVGAAAHIEKAGKTEDSSLPTREDLVWRPIDEVGAAWGVVKRIHFDYDKSDIKKEWIEGLNNNAKFMVDNPQYVMRIEGHCDERGTNEYNNALGERRAMAARNYLIGKGVAADRIHIISYGEERPLAFCHDESCWWQNRRGDFLVAERK